MDSLKNTNHRPMRLHTINMQCTCRQNQLLGLNSAMAIPNPTPTSPPLLLQKCAGKNVKVFRYIIP